MTIAVSYMGTKRQLADEVATVVSKSTTGGPLLDLFSGMCSVARKMTGRRAVWCNDAQVYANTLATAEFCSKIDALDAEYMVNLAEPYFRSNLSKLTRRFSKQLSAESAAIGTSSVKSIQTCMSATQHIAINPDLERERQRLRKKPDTRPYRLFSITFGASYFSLRQCCEIDSIRFAVDELLRTREIEAESHRWMVLAICQVASRVSNTTGHFAQYLKPNTANVDRVASQFARSVWSEWREALRNCQSCGTAEWRSNNRAFRGDANGILRRLMAAGTAPGVIYADPPYKADQYSRYYHIYETMVLYDYPISSGMGRYRGDRFVSPYSHKTRVNHEFEGLVSLSSNLGSDLILSYPSNGLINGGNLKILDILRHNYPNVEVVFETDFEHSSLGASKGFEKHKVKEFIFHSHH